MSESQNESNYSSPIQRKQILRQCLDKTIQLQERQDLESLKTLQEVFLEADNVNDMSLDEKTEHQDQILMDSELMCVSSQVINSCTNLLTKENNTFNDAEFADKILQYVLKLPDTEDMNEPRWENLAVLVMPQFKLPANFNGMMDLVREVAEEEEETARNSEAETTGRVSLKPARTRRTRLVEAAVKRPVNVTELEAEAVSTEIVHKIKKIIDVTYRRENEPIDYFKLVIHPQSFGKTVENMLHVAFLIKDGQVKLTTDLEGNLVLRPVSKELHTKVIRKEIDAETYTQQIISINMDQWKVIKDALRIREPMIKYE